MATGSNSRGLVILLLTSGFFITGLLFDYMPLIVDNQIKRTVELATNEEIKALWSKPPVEFHSYYWLYDILNADQFLKGAKVQLRKVGPYHFSSKIEKRIIELSQNKLRLIYNTTRYFYLNESELLEGQLEEPLRLLNPIYVSLMEGSRVQAARLDPSQAATVVASANRLAARSNETLIMEATPRSALLGRKVELIARARKLIETFGLDAKLPVSLQGDIFGYVAMANGTWTGPLEIYTGYQASMPALGNVISYQGRRRLSEYQGKCSRLQTSAGELRPMPLESNQVLEMFMPNFCRIFHLVPTGVRKFREGAAIAYTLAPADFLSADAYPEHKCLCVNGTKDNYCSLNGVLELAPCASFSPLVAVVGGIEPDERVKDSIADWDPDLISSEMDFLPAPDNSAHLLLLKRIGVPLKADITLTLFMKVERDEKFNQAGSLPNVSYIPVVTVREIGAIPPKLAGVIVSLESFLALSHHIKVIMYLSALVLLCWLTGYYYSRSTRERVVPSDPGAGSGSGGRRGRDDSGGGAGGTGHDSGASDRANSADSNRSQPPSRISHSSLDAGGNGSDASGDSNQRAAGLARERRAPAHAASGYAGGFGADPAARDRRQEQQPQPQPQPPQPSDASRKADNLKQYQQQQQQQNQKQRGPQQPSLTRRPSRTFSKVDELLAQRQAENQTNGQDVAASKTAAGAELGPDKAAGAQSEEGAQKPSETEEARRSRKNWFLKVCSNFVRMLNNLRTTISDAGQLDISENDYQDKQLEMLAGKIDNWYNGNEDGSEADAACSSSPAAAAPATESTGSDKQKSSGQESQAKSGAKQSGEAGSPPAAPPAALSRQRREAKDDEPAAAGSKPSSPVIQARPAEQPPTRPPPTTATLVTTEMAAAPEPAPTTTSKPAASSPSQSQQTLGGVGGGGDPSLNSQARPTSNASSKRKESGQSNRTIINKSDTSGDESLVSSAEDKAKALEQLELTLENKKGVGADYYSAATAAPAAAAPPPASGGESRAVQPGAKKPTMINSSTSIDSTFDQMAAEANGLVSNGFADPTKAASQEQQLPAKGQSDQAGLANHWPANQSGKLNDQIDDQSNELAANGVGDNDGQRQRYLQSTQPTMLAKEKDERRDSGYRVSHKF